ncbi:DUF4350 domain-containing protein [Salinibacterium sp. dk2585]|uniref:DUF4350 domain-containing protein n=1 Tax=unclassified Salinibacterium TaxID=2632331 RepID=UPI0011C25106|nr:MULTISPECIES: DUF4350 domain-containing protein [unclassified Salinibacterium]QEE60879.1 DUF4350 domain-containing protein [Salinibacterium sp. dk2585]TXK55950.1 DUF4350 domain-containing protein [Salinibacterium sp. dk5596]
MSAAPSTVATQTVRATARRWVYWIVFAVAALTLAMIAFIGAGAGRPLGVPLDPEGPGPAGAKALVEVLRDRGVAVTLTESMADTREAVKADATTLVLHDRSGILAADAAASAARMAEHLVVIDPTYDVLSALAPEVAHAGAVEGVLDADCSLAPVQRAERVVGDGQGYRHIGDSQDVTTCLDSGDSIASLIQLREAGRTVSVVGTTAAFSNERIAEHGNAALALGLLGEHPHLVWYVPGLGDTSGDAPDIAELTPAWVTPVTVLLILVVVAAGVAQGRRLGPLVVERLPVTVRATETMEGRARLYQRSSARLRALDALRVGTVQRLAGMVKLPATAPVEQVADLVAALVGQAPERVRALLVGTIPHSDREMIELSDGLLELERAVAEATRP